jgi:hypothetical protein
MEKETLRPFSRRGRGSALRSQKTSCSPAASRFVGEGVGLGFVGFGARGWVARAAFLDGGLEIRWWSVSDRGLSVLGHRRAGF